MKKPVKDFIITYKSREHYEVLGWVRAASLQEALAKARRELKHEIVRYGVINATVAEWNGAESVRFT